MRRKFDTLASLPHEQRDEQINEMVIGLNQLSDDMKTLMLKTNLEILAQLSEEKRMRCMRSMDKAMATVPSAKALT